MSTPDILLASLPAPIAAALAGFTCDGNNLRTASQSNVFRFTRSDEARILKISNSRVDAPLSHEADIMRWLSGKLPVADVIAYEREDTSEYLVASCIPGTAGHHRDVHADPGKLITLFADGLRHVHTVAPEGCPYDRTPDAMIARGWRRIAEGRVPRRYVEDTGLGEDAKDVLSLLEREKPDADAVVFNHGDYCLPNIMIDGEAITGFIDLGHAGIGDPHRDYIAARYTVNRNLGPEWIAPFFGTLGVTPDEDKLAWYGAMQAFD